MLPANYTGQGKICLVTLVKGKMYLKPLLINHFAGVECTHGVYLQDSFEGIEGQ